MAPHAEPEPPLVDDEPYYYGTNDLPHEITQAQRYPETGICILIVGAGMGGLTAAMECWRKGHLVRIVERNPYPMLTGDTFSIGPSVLKLFRHWPELEKEVYDVHCDAHVRYFRHFGDHLYGPTECVWNDSEEKQGRVGPRVAFIQNRVKFFEMILRQVKRLGILIEWGNPVKDYFEEAKEGKAGVVLEDGSVRRADVVIAADGIKTRSGPIIRGYDTKPRESGTAIYRTAYDGQIAYQDPLVQEIFQLPEDGRPLFDFWMGPGMHFGAAMSKDFVSWALTHVDDGSARESWDPEVSPEEVLSMMEKENPGWHPAVPTLIRTAPKGSIVHWKLMWRDLEEKWTSPTGRVVQLGDCVHSFLPASGNGATQAMEDAITLAICLQLGGKTNIPNATRVYNKLRYERVACAQKLGFINSAAKHRKDWSEIYNDPKQIRTRIPRWIYRHDPEQYAYENYGVAFNHIVSDAPFKNTNIPPGHSPTPLPLDKALEDLAKGVTMELDGDWS